MRRNEYTVEFRMYSESLNPHDITRELGLEPYQVRTHGSIGPGGRLQIGMWAYNGGHDSVFWESLTEGLTFVLDKLWPHRDFIKSRRDTQTIWWCEHFHGAFDGDPRLDAALLKRLGEFGAELFIDTYICAEDDSAIVLDKDLLN